MHKLFQEKGFVKKEEMTTSSGVSGGGGGEGGSSGTSTSATKKKKKKQTAEAAAATAADRSILELGAAKGIKVLDSSKPKQDSMTKVRKPQQTRAEKRKAKQEERQILGVSAAVTPAYGEMLQLYVVLTVIVLTVGSYSGLQRRRRRRLLVSAR